ncbi:MAG: PEP-CTERM sorting domain-containing protein [Proteobacteria bacterium]|nr:PEP-CTERM sorting domain-containing protein [Pseudomonadota bacterium]
MPGVRLRICRVWCPGHNAGRASTYPPEPSAVLVMGLGLVASGVRRRQ